MRGREGGREGGRGGNVVGMKGRPAYCLPGSGLLLVEREASFQ